MNVAILVNLEIYRISDNPQFSRDCFGSMATVCCSMPMLTTSPEASRSLIESVYFRLRADIIHGVYAPGSKLRVEHIRGQYGASSGTLREALALLVADQLVEAQAQRGFCVAPMSLEDIEDITRTRTLLECTALRDAMQHGGDDWEAGIVSAYHKLSLAEAKLAPGKTEVFAEWENRNREFHEALVAACKSHWVLRLRSLLYQQSLRYRYLSTVTGPVPESVHDEHRLIVEAVLARDADRADAEMARHIAFSVETIRKHGLLERAQHTDRNRAA